MLKSPVDVIALKVLFHSEDVSGVEPAVSGISMCQSLQELFRRLSQFHKGFSYRFKTIPYLFCLEVAGVRHLSAEPRGLPFMMGYEIKLGIVDHDLMVRSLKAQYVRDVA